MDLKTIFLNSLYDEQMGFFCAHEYSENLEELLIDELNVKQFNLFKEWKESEIRTPNNDCNGATDLLAKKLDRIEAILEKLTVRLEAIEENQTSANTTIADVVAPMYERITGIEKVLGEIMTRFEATEEKTNNEVDRTSDVVEPIVNKIDGMEKVLEKIINRLEQTEKDTNKSALEQNKKTEVFQENLLTRMKEIEQRVKQSKDVSNSGNSGKPVNEIVLPTRQKEPEEPKKENQQLKNVSITLEKVEILSDYSFGDVHVKKGELYGLLRPDLDFFWLVNISTGKTIGNVLCNHCKRLYIPCTLHYKMVNVKM